jgi:hypothetical protein
MTGCSVRATAVRGCGVVAMAVASSLGTGSASAQSSCPAPDPLRYNEVQQKAIHNANPRTIRLTAAGLAAAAVALIATTAVTGKPGGPEIVQKLVDDARRTVWSITRPVITRPEGRDYPQITFAPGDMITLSAGGCARRGGNPPPNGPAVPYVTGDADAINDVERARSGQAHLHNGVMHIPYLMPADVMRPIAQYLGTHSIPRAAQVIPGAHLRLGYLR